MIVVGGGAGTRFGSDKLLADIGGLPLVSHTLAAVIPCVDVCVLVCSDEVADVIGPIHPDVVTASPGSTRTQSEISGLTALPGEVALIGIHDAARPAVSTELVMRLYEVASETGGAVPVLTTGVAIVERETKRPVEGLGRAQTPQVFRGPEMLAAYRSAATAGFAGHDTADVMARFSTLEIAAVMGDPTNLKVTYPKDLEAVRATLTGSSRT